MTWPKVVVGGHPNTGTSFLCELVAAMGFSPGPPDRLKAADDHNPWGYWEYMPLTGLARELSGFCDEMQVRGTWPDEPPRFGPQARARLRRMAEADGVEVFKDCGLALSYPLYPGAKFVVITRFWEHVYHSGGYAPRGVTPEGFLRGFGKYDRLVDGMERKVPVLRVCYEDFAADFDGAVEDLAAHLGVGANAGKLHHIWRPRKHGRQGDH